MILQDGELYKACLEKWGERLQTDMLIEEMAELTQAIIKHRRSKGKTTLDNFKNLLEEIADVDLMLGQLKFMVQGQTAEIQEYRIKKIMRLNEMLGVKDTD